MTGWRLCYRGGASLDGWPRAYRGGEDEMMMTATAKCTHERTENGEHRGYVASVAVHPYTDENGAAAGGITYVQRCLVCGAERQVNQNQLAYEYGTWGPDAETRRQREVARQERVRREQEAAEDAAMKAAGIKVLERVERDGYHTMIRMEVHGEWKSTPEWQVEEAANQPDNGDGLVQVYRAVLRHARAK